MRNVPIFASLVLLASGCAPAMQRSIPHRPIFDRDTNTIWIVEHDQPPSGDQEVRVIVCHREATPACIRVQPPDSRDGGDYARWLDSLPKSVRARATAAESAPSPGGAPE